MSIPFSTHTITVTRTQPTDGGAADPYDPGVDGETTTTIAAGVRAVVKPPATATFKLAGGDRVVYETTITCDPTSAPVLAGDTVTDSDGNVWTVMWVAATTVMIPHLQLGSRLVTGDT